jgi:hypothetical protein
MGKLLTMALGIQVAIAKSAYNLIDELVLERAFLERVEL